MCCISNVVKYVKYMLLVPSCLRSYIRSRFFCLYLHLHPSQGKLWEKNPILMGWDISNIRVWYTALKAHNSVCGRALVLNTQLWVKGMFC